MHQAPESSRAQRPTWPWLALIIIAYVVIASLYAVRVPAWQAPDEPAHYNYIHELASTGQFPVLQMGDYDEAYLEHLKSQRFPPSLPIDPVRYEAHQPPLYYVLASAIFRLTQGQLLFLRLFSVALGAIFVVLTYEIARQIYPQRAAVRLAAAAFVAFLPMHVAMAASVNNDALAEVLLAGILLLSMHYVKGWLLGSDQPGWLQALALGLLLGMALVTKVSAYVAIPVVLAALIIAGYEARRVAKYPGGRNPLNAPLPGSSGAALRSSPATLHSSLSTLFTHAVLIFLPALLIALPWYVRNAQLYGHLDFLARRWHDTVVVGQLRTGDFLAQAGLGGLVERMGVWSFDSFWGVFGWMGVWMDGRVYTALLAFSLATGVGCLALFMRKVGSGEWRVESGRASDALAFDNSLVPPPSTLHPPLPTPLPPPSTRFHRWSLALLGLSGLLTFGVYVSYNVIFVQPQGRYLFPALPAIALAVALGWQEVVSRPAAARWAGVSLLATAGLAGLIGLLRKGIDKWSVAILGGAGLALAGWSLGILRISGLWRVRLEALVFGLPFVALPLLDLYALSAFILPQLG